MTDYGPLDEGVTTPPTDAPSAEQAQREVYVVHTPRGFTESFDRNTIETLELLGLIRHERDGHVMEIGNPPRPHGALHHFYKEASDE